MEQRIALIPAYEPTETLAVLARQLLETGFRVVVVDDGSGSAYTPVFHALPAGVRLISYMPNCGKGRALKTAYRELMREGAQGVVVTLDADGQHTPADAARVAAAAAQYPGTLVLGVRDFGRGTPLRSRLGNRFSSLLYRAAGGEWVRDTQTGLRGFSAGLISFLLRAEGTRYEYEMNVLMQCARRGIPLRQVPIETIYLDGNRSSHFDTVRDSARVVGNVVKFAGSSLTGFAIDYTLYGVLVTVLGGLGTAVSVPVANVAARAVSASANFAINKHFVFKSRASTLRTGLQYAGLAVCILAGNTVLLSALVNGLGANKYAAKLVTEVTFFGLQLAGAALSGSSATKRAAPAPEK
jgi:glycosyltransferase involved in cell wall biosynthesis